MSMNPNNRLTPSLVLMLATFSCFAATKAQEDQTYGDLQKARQLSTAQGKVMSEKEQQVADMQLNIDLLKLTQEYEKLQKAENQINKVKIDPIKPNVARSNNEHASTTSAESSLQQSNAVSEFQYKQVEAWMKEMSDEVYLVDVTEIAGRVTGDFWHDGTYSAISQGEIIGNWYVEQLDFDKAKLSEVKPSGKTKKVKTITRKTEEETLYIFSRIEQYKQTILEQRLNSAGASSINAGLGMMPSTMVTNSSPTPGAMYK